MISRSTVNFCYDMASLDGSDNLFGDGDINAVFGSMLSAGSFDGFGFDFGKSISNGGSIRVTKVLRIGFWFSFGGSFHDNWSTSFADDFFASLFVSDFLADNVVGNTNIFGTGCARLDFQSIGSMFANTGNMSYNTGMVTEMTIELRISLSLWFGAGQSHSNQHRNQSDLGNHDFFPRIE